MLARMDHATESSPGAAKRALRRRMRAVWASRDLESDAIAAGARAVELPEVVAARTVAAYAELPGELSTGELIAELHRRGVRVLLPVLLADDALGWRVAAPGVELTDGRRGTRHPAAGTAADDTGTAAAALADADVVIVPGLAYDASGARLGRGGGSYDRALGELSAGTVVVALAPDVAVLEAVPTEAHDRRVDVVVTPTRILRTPEAGC